MGQSSSSGISQSDLLALKQAAATLLELCDPYIPPLFAGDLRANMSPDSIEAAANVDAKLDALEMHLRKIDSIWSVIVTAALAHFAQLPERILGGSDIRIQQGEQVEAQAKAKSDDDDDDDNDNPQGDAAVSSVLALRRLAEAACAWETACLVTRIESLKRFWPTDKAYTIVSHFRFWFSMKQQLLERTAQFFPDVGLATRKQCVQRLFPVFYDAPSSCNFRNRLREQYRSLIKDCFMYHSYKPRAKTPPKVISANLMQDFGGLGMQTLFRDASSPADQPLLLYFVAFLARYPGFAGNQGHQIFFKETLEPACRNLDQHVTFRVRPFSTIDVKASTAAELAQDTAQTEAFLLDGVEWVDTPQIKGIPLGLAMLDLIVRGFFVGAKLSDNTYEQCTGLPSPAMILSSTLVRIPFRLVEENRDRWCSQLFDFCENKAPSLGAGKKKLNDAEKRGKNVQRVMEHYRAIERLLLQQRLRRAPTLRRLNYDCERIVMSFLYKSAGPKDFLRHFQTPPSWAHTFVAEDTVKHRNEEKDDNEE